MTRAEAVQAANCHANNMVARQMPDPDEARLKRLKIRAWRRGTKEMDLILGPYADAHLPTMDSAALDAFEALLAENDQDIYPWITGASVVPARHAGMVAALVSFAQARHGR